MTGALLEFFASNLPALSDVGQAFLCRTVEELHLAAGEQIFAKGEPGMGLYFLRSGRVGIRKETGFEEKTQIIALLDSGAPFGERGLLQDMVHGAGALAVDDCTLGLLRRADYEIFLQEFQNDGRLLLEWVLLRVSMRLEKASERLAHIL